MAYVCVCVCVCVCVGGVIITLCQEVEEQGHDGFSAGLLLFQASELVSTFHHRAASP